MSETTMTADEVRDVLTWMRGEVQEFAAAELPRSAQQQKGAAQDAEVALTHALAALDAVARVRALHACVVSADHPHALPSCRECTRRYGGWAAYPCPTIRALDGKAT